jgi:hypothetical protein
MQQPASYLVLFSATCAWPEYRGFINSAVAGQWLHESYVVISSHRSAPLFVVADNICSSAFGYSPAVAVTVLSCAACCRRQKMLAALKSANTLLAKSEQKPDPLKEKPALERKVAKALAMHHGALTAQIEAVLAQWELLQQQVVADMSWRELDMQVGCRFRFA